MTLVDPCLMRGEQFSRWFTLQWKLHHHFLMVVGFNHAGNSGGIFDTVTKKEHDCLKIQYIHLQFYSMTLHLEEVLLLDGQTARYCNAQHHLAVTLWAVIISIIKLLRVAAFTKNATKCKCSKNLEFTFKQYENTNITERVQGRHKEMSFNL